MCVHSACGICSEQDIKSREFNLFRSSSTVPHSLRFATWFFYRRRLVFLFLLFSQGNLLIDRLCGLVVRVLGYRSGGPGSIPGTTRFSGEKTVVGLERGSLSLVSTIEELLDRKVAAPVWKTENTAGGMRHADHVAFSIRKSWQSLRR
jgi:hypothetical protein